MIRRSEPDELLQGDTWQWIITLDEYPATDGWTLTYDFSGAGSLIFPCATDADGISYDVTIPFATTQALTPGLYYWNAYVQATSGTYAGQKFTVRRSTLRVVSNYEALGPGAKQLFAEKMLPIVEAEIMARLTGAGAGGAHQAYAIEGRSISKIPIMDLYKLRAKFASELMMASRGGRLPPVAVNFARRPAGLPGGAGDKGSAGGGWWGVE